MCKNEIGNTEHAQGLMFLSTHYRSFKSFPVFPVNHLHWYWQPNQINQETEHKTTAQNNQSGSNENHKPLNTGISQTRETDTAWFSWLSRHPDRKWSGSILWCRKPARGITTFRVGQLLTKSDQTARVTHHQLTQQTRTDTIQRHGKLCRKFRIHKTESPKVQSLQQQNNHYYRQ